MPHPLIATALVPELLRAHARRDGYLFVPGLLPPERVAAVRAVVDEALARRGWLVDGTSDPSLRLGRWDDTRWTGFFAEILSTDAYQTLAAAPELIAVLRVVVGDDPQLHVGDVCRLVSPGALDLTTPPHQDAAYLKDADAVWTAWMALSPCPIALGPLAILPGSHTAGLRPHAPVSTGDGVVGTDVPDDAPWHAADLALGDVIFFSSLTVHRALPNTTRDELRVSVDYRYRPRASSDRS